MHRCEKNKGPLPSGTYTLRARIDKTQGSVELANRLYKPNESDWAKQPALTNPRTGIQFLPADKGAPRFWAWGSARVRLVPRSGDMCGRDGFYLHNSHKGESHGCIEVGSTPEGMDFFTCLITYTGDPKGPEELSLAVEYGHPDQRTQGRTERP